jgi:hypothetical protein
VQGDIAGRPDDACGAWVGTTVAHGGETQKQGTG